MRAPSRCRAAPGRGAVSEGGAGGLPAQGPAISVRFAHDSASGAGPPLRARLDRPFATGGTAPRGAAASRQARAPRAARATTDLPLEQCQPFMLPGGRADSTTIATSRTSPPRSFLPRRALNALRTLTRALAAAASRPAWWPERRQEGRPRCGSAMPRFPDVASRKWRSAGWPLPDRRGQRAGRTRAA